jgi:hypothetical protein
VTTSSNLPTGFFRRADSQELWRRRPVDEMRLQGRFMMQFFPRMWAADTVASTLPVSPPPLCHHGKQALANGHFRHKAPSSHPDGEHHLDILAEPLQLRFVVHGHHHESLTGSLPGGISVRGLGQAEAWWVELPAQAD